MSLLADKTVVVLEAFTSPLILNSGDGICSVYGSTESKKVKRNTQDSSSGNVIEAMFTFQSYDEVVVRSMPPRCEVSFHY